MKVLMWMLVSAFASSFAYAENVEFQSGFTRISPTLDGTAYSVEHCIQDPPEAPAQCTFLQNLSKRDMKSLKGHLSRVLFGEEALIGGGAVAAIAGGFWVGVVAGDAVAIYAGMYSTIPNGAYVAAPFVSAMGTGEVYNYVVNGVYAQAQRMEDQTYLKAEFKKALQSDSPMLFPDGNSSAAMLASLLKSKVKN